MKNDKLSANVDLIVLSIADRLTAFTQTGYDKAALDAASDTQAIPWALSRLHEAMLDLFMDLRDVTNG